MEWSEKYGVSILNIDKSFSMGDLLHKKNQESRSFIIFFFLFLIQC